MLTLVEKRFKREDSRSPQSLTGLRLEPPMRNLRFQAAPEDSLLCRRFRRRRMGVIRSVCSEIELCLSANASRRATWQACLYSELISGAAQWETHKARYADSFLTPF
jgi:hypothetical protein